jgi:hypothetical protein
MEAAQNILVFMEMFRSWTGLYSSEPQFSFGEIRPELESLFGNRFTDKSLRVPAWQRAIKSRFGESVEYRESRLPEF